jgi:hypothetical protein
MISFVFSSWITSSQILLKQEKSKTAIHKFTCCESDSDLVQERIVMVDEGFSHLIKDEQVRWITLSGRRTSTFKI